MIRHPQAATGTPDVVAVRSAAYQQVRALFDRYDRLVADGAGVEARRALAEDICVQLTVHITADEELFYPAVRAAVRDEAVIGEAAAMHHGARHLIADIVDATSPEGMLDERVKGLRVRVDRHLEQEQRQLHPRLQAASADLGRLGARLVERRRELMAEMEALEG